MRRAIKRGVAVVAASVLVAGVAFGQGRERPGAMFERADSNGDGLVSKDEFLKARGEQFASRDRNGDGFIDSADLGERAKRRARVSQAMNAITTQLDADGDGKVSKDEFIAGGAKLFDRADADNSGTLDRKEIDAAKANVREAAGR